MTEDGWRVWMEGGVVGGGAPRDWMGPVFACALGSALGVCGAGGSGCSRAPVLCGCAFGRVRRTTAVVFVVFGAAEHLR